MLVLYYLWKALLEQGYLPKINGLHSLQGSDLVPCNIDERLDVVTLDRLSNINGG